jgi:molybdopterin/thiamine biosynthesis adenylyltransferase
MMAGELRILPDQLAAFQDAMLAEAPLESVAACTAGWWVDDGGGIHLLWRSFRVADDGDYLRRGGAGAVVKPEFLAPTVKRVRSSREALVLAHTHPFSDIPGFSGIDDGGEDVLIPKVRERAPDAPHGGFVLGRRGGSARTWPPGEGSPRPLDLRGMVGVSVPGADVATYSRQDLALGPGTAAQLAKRQVAVVGVGGLGWDVGALLWSHGVGRLVLIDGDHIEEHNRPRLRGARSADVGSVKPAALAEQLRRTRSTGTIEAIGSWFDGAEARAAAAQSDVIVVATDNLASRLEVDRFARRLLVPVVDVGVNIQVREGHVHRVGGRVNVSWPTGPCLSCMGVLTPDAVALEVDPLGYRGMGRDPEAAVAAFNATLAGLGAVETLDLLLGFRGHAPGSRYLVYDGLRGTVREIGVPAPGVCGACADLPGAVFGALP